MAGGNFILHEGFSILKSFCGSLHWVKLWGEGIMKIRSALNYSLVWALILVMALPLCFTLQFYYWYFPILWGHYLLQLVKYNLIWRLFCFFTKRINYLLGSLLLINKLWVFFSNFLLWKLVEVDHKVLFIRRDGCWPFHQLKSPAVLLLSF